MSSRPAEGRDEFAAPTIAPPLARLLSAPEEARRQLEICNACRYCEGFCDVFPAMTRRREFGAGDLMQLAHLCHNCRGCHYACQYAPPHEFAINIPAALAELREESWAANAWPGALGSVFRRGGLGLGLALAGGVAAIIALAALFGGGEGESFYGVVPHEVMVAVFAPAFVFAIAASAVSVRRFSRAGGAPLRWGDLWAALGDGAGLRNLSGGHGEGCNYEAEDAFSNARRRAHQWTLWGFLLCFAATCSGTIMHYVFAWPAPYGLATPPKLFGVPGGVLLCLGTARLLQLRARADPALAAKGAAGGEVAFTGLLFLTGASGLALYGLRETGAMAALLVIHLGAVVGFFLTIPYSKMIHAPYRLAALMRERAESRRR